MAAVRVRLQLSALHAENRGRPGVLLLPDLEQDDRADHQQAPQDLERRHHLAQKDERQHSGHDRFKSGGDAGAGGADAADALEIEAEGQDEMALKLFEELTRLLAS